MPKQFNQFIVRLEAGVWLADGEGDPARTLVEENAKRFAAHHVATDAIREARKFRPFKNASVRTIPGRWEDVPDEPMGSFASFP